MENETQKTESEQKETKRKTKNAFSEKEDQQLKTLVDQYGLKNWPTIAKFLPNRSPRQCRERYNLYLREDLSNTPWTNDEDALLIRLVAKFGHKWSKMTQNFPNRTANNIKNRFKQHQRHLKRHSRQGDPKGVVSDPIVIAHMNFYNEVVKERQEQLQAQTHTQIHPESSISELTINNPHDYHLNSDEIQQTDHNITINHIKPNNAV